ncbi:MAG TPA: hypothetical protein VKT22_00080 [Steroidobacteraceae bacterium]|nr:hypothetical protein [Steroidobacteraceae bacterium]
MFIRVRLTAHAAALAAVGILASVRPAAAQPPQSYPASPPQPYPGQQYILVSPPPPTEPRVHGFIDVGYSDPIDNTQNILQGGYTVGGGLLVSVAPASPLDLRFDFNYTENHVTQSFLAQNVPSSATYARGDLYLWDATLDLQFNLGARGRVNPYLFGGGGAYNTDFYFKSITYPSGGFCDPYSGFCGYASETRDHSSITKFGWNAGAGIEMPLAPWGPKFFIEGRFTRVLQGNGQPPLKFIPITVGVRF